jgi:Mrp family chromosome partitioning ATPase
MSKIHKALGRVKTDRSDQATHYSHVKRPTDTSRSGQFMALDPNNIALSRVPKVPCDEDIFQSNRLLSDSSDKPHPAQGAYRMLRTRLMKVMRSNNWRILGVSSIGQNEGKTFTSINLAISIAAEIGQEAILVDLDLRRPSVYQSMGISADDFVSIREYLENDQRDLSDLLICPNIERLGCILSSVPLNRSSDVLASPRGIQLFSELRDRIDPKTVVIVDLPPLMAADDALAVAPMMDALLLVVAEGEAERSDLVDVRHLVDEFNFVGCVLNKSIEKDSKRASYY